MINEMMKFSDDKSKHEKMKNYKDKYEEYKKKYNYYFKESLRLAEKSENGGSGRKKLVKKKKWDGLPNEITPLFVSEYKKWEIK
jgi:hypothetical protein